MAETKSVIRQRNGDIYEDLHASTVWYVKEVNGVIIVKDSEGNYDFVRKADIVALTQDPYDRVKMTIAYKGPTLFESPVDITLVN